METTKGICELNVTYYGIIFWSKLFIVHFQRPDTFQVWIVCGMPQMTVV